MNDVNFNGILISKRDYFALPPTMRVVAEHPMVLATVSGKQTFVRALLF
jgi:hypothetical protein